MDSFHLPSTPLTPEVCLNPAKGLLSLRGESYPEHVLSFYAPILETIKTVLEEGQLTLLRVEMHITYYNSASAKAFHRIFQMLNKAAENGCAIHLFWQFDEEDDMARDLGNDIQEDFPAIQVVGVQMATAV
jgi:hypothetical protein